MQNNYFGDIKMNFGFGCMRLPMKGEEVDYEQVCTMVDEFIGKGFDYFDTAHGYLNGKSEVAINKCLTSRYPRESYILTNKLSGWYFKNQEEIRPLVQQQLDICGVDYFDFYLMHAQNKERFEHFKRCKAYETAFELKKEGKIKHVGISFHDTAEVLEEILTEYSEIEVVQIQFNYLDYNDSAIQSRKCYEVCEKFNKPVIIMEPVKGGTLANLPEAAQKVFDELGDASYPSYAIRFAASPKQVMMVLSGMSSIEQMRDNLSFMSDFKPINDKELEAISKVVAIYNSLNAIACTSCRYCVDGCPQKILIPDLFACMNSKKLPNNWNADVYYNTVYTVRNGKASSCIKCGKCEKACPQKLPIRELLVKVAETFEKKK